MARTHINDSIFKPESIAELRAVVQGRIASITTMIYVQDTLSCSRDGKSQNIGTDLHAKREALTECLVWIDHVISVQAKSKRSPLQKWLKKWFRA